MSGWRFFWSISGWHRCCHLDLWGASSFPGSSRQPFRWSRARLWEPAQVIRGKGDWDVWAWIVTPVCLSRTIVSRVPQAVFFATATSNSPPPPPHTYCLIQSADPHSISQRRGSFTGILKSTQAGFRRLWCSQTPERWECCVSRCRLHPSDTSAPCNGTGKGQSGERYILGGRHERQR